MTPVIQAAQYGNTLLLWLQQPDGNEILQRFTCDLRIERLDKCNELRLELCSVGAHYSHVLRGYHKHGDVIVGYGFTKNAIKGTRRVNAQARAAKVTAERGGRLWQPPWVHAARNQARLSK